MTFRLSFIIYFQITELFDDRNISSIKLAQEVIKNEIIFDEWNCTVTNYWKLPIIIAKLETKGLLLYESQ